MVRSLKFPKVQLIICLLLISLTAAVTFPTLITFQLIFLCILFNVFFDLVFTYLKKRVLFIPYAATVTGLIMGLVINQSAYLFQIILVSALTMGIKNFLRVKNRHIFNPAATGLFLFSLIFSEYLGWWGVSFQNINQFNLQNLIFFLILLTPGLISFIRLKKHYSIATFLILNAVISHIFFPSHTNLLLTTFNLILNPSTLFFALVMLPEPMTSPVKPINQIIYGAIIAIIPFIFSLPLVFDFLTKNNIAFDPLLFALLLGNLIFFKNR